MRNRKVPAPGAARALTALVLALALCLCACGGPDAAQLASRALGIDAAGAEVAAFRRQHMAPGEMEQIRLPRKLLEGAAGPITISVEEGSNA